MVAEAMLAARYVDAALKAGIDREEINTTLAKIADHSAISEFWITDEIGQVAYTNVEGVRFVFPTDPEGSTQAAPFAALLGGAEAVVVQGIRKRELNGAPFKYVGVSGIDQPRIVQVVVAAAEISAD